MLNYEESQFIQNESPGTLKWLSSKGTSYECYKEFKSSFSPAQELDLTVSTIRIIIGAIYKPLQYTFFYWTVLLFILYKFNFKHKVMKLVLTYYTLRSISEIFKQISELWPHYFVNSNTGCIFDSIHPYKWLFKIELGNVFSILGEIIGDLYPLLRTIEIVNSKKEAISVIFTSILFNISKIVLAAYNLTLGPSNIYDNNGMYNTEKINKYNLNLTFIRLIVTYASAIYSISVWIVIRRYIHQTKYSEYSNFSKKFKNVPEYRLSCMQIFNFISMLLVSSAGILHMIYHIKNAETGVDFTMEELRDFLAGLQYFMIFVDQIFLIHSNNISTNSAEIYSRSYNNKYSSGRFRYENMNYSVSNSDLLNHISSTNSVELGTTFISDSTPLNTNNDFGFLNDAKYKELTSYNIDYNKYNNK
ncbi:hypothetical protein BCR32DRAFT_268680 [Anaeromyces robustus]|uniref:Uncharacterized protein n=1 Tax=Anaeromyces robustus TaxID=1754192 RepID=A0A1Y1X4M8_9FUNG|nr:hypothetical protein BCR32DRAFT_268680 [Anaeromyces robustus]|eukprot:ORX80769.1 hypothetical protein BCR32DRAFT_268680 [Anaeromyces robustus]